MPVERLPEFLDFFHREVGIRAGLDVPDAGGATRRDLALYDMDPHRSRSTSASGRPWRSQPGSGDGYYNRRIEQEVAQLGGRKSLYSTRSTSRRVLGHYDGEQYHQLKKTYDPDGRLLDLYDKTVGRR